MNVGWGVGLVLRGRWLELLSRRGLYNEGPGEGFRSTKVAELYEKRDGVTVTIGRIALVRAF